tara:strand:+ start:817 stop:2550 length:1734 start_codon:yes stop_codon:yes gene_type:complete
MAKIPTFQRSRGVPTTSGVGSPIFVPETYDAQKQVAQLFTTIQGGVEAYEVKQGNAELTTANTAATIAFSKLEAEMLKEDPRAAVSKYAQKSNEIHIATTAGLGKRALEAYQKQFQILSAKSQISVESSAAARLKDQQAGSLTTNLDALALAATQAGNNTVGYRISKRSGIANIDAAIKDGTIKAKAGALLKNKFKSDLAKGAIDSMVRTAPLADLMSIHEQMRNDKFTDSSLAGFWAELDSSEKLSMQNKILSAQEHVVNAAFRAEGLSAKTLRLSQNKSHAQNMVKIMTSNAGIKGAIAPTKIELYEQLGKQEITSDQLKDAMAALNNQNATSSDQSFIGDIRKQTREAKNKEEIEAIQDLLDSGLGKGGKLTLQDHGVLSDRLTTQLTKTPQALNQKIFSNALDKLVKSGDYLDKILPGAKDRAAIVQIQFEADLRDGVEPSTAFQNALDSFRSRGGATLNAIAVPRLGPAKKLSEWTLADANETLERTKIEFRGSPSTLAIQLINLNALIGYLTAQEAATAAAEKSKGIPASPAGATGIPEHMKQFGPASPAVSTAKPVENLTDKLNILRGGN